MARKKRTSEAVVRAEKRAAGLASISATLDLGNEMTLASFRQAIDDFRESLNEYNEKLSALDSLGNGIDVAEENLDDLTSRMLAAVAAKFGRDSDQYEQAGGTRTSERKSATRTTTTPTPVTN